jgi:hypothetical protein
LGSIWNKQVKEGKVTATVPRARWGNMTANERRKKALYFPMLVAKEGKRRCT